MPDPQTPEEVIEVPISNTEPHSPCKVCGIVVAECICWDLFCRRCCCNVDCCACDSPLVHHRRCAACGDEEQDATSLFEKFPMSAFGDFVCSSCGGMDWCVDTACQFYALQSAQPCSSCWRVDAQESLLHCNGSCGKLHHQSCMEVADRPATCQHANQFYVCQPCKSNAASVACDSCKQPSNGIKKRFKSGVR